MENGVKQCIPLNILFIWEKWYVRIQVREKEIYLYTLLANPKGVKGLYSVALHWQWTKSCCSLAKDKINILKGNDETLISLHYIIFLRQMKNDCVGM